MPQLVLNSMLLWFVYLPGSRRRAYIVAGVYTCGALTLKGTLSTGAVCGAETVVGPIGKWSILGNSGSRWSRSTDGSSDKLSKSWRAPGAKWQTHNNTRADGPINILSIVLKQNPKQLTETAFGQTFHIAVTVVGESAGITLFSVFFHFSLPLMVCIHYFIILILFVALFCSQISSNVQVLGSAKYEHIKNAKVSGSTSACA